MLTYRSFPCYDDDGLCETSLNPEEKIRVIIGNIHHTQIASAMDQIRQHFVVDDDGSICLTRQQLNLLTRIVDFNNVTVI